MPNLSHYLKTGFITTEQAALALGVSARRVVALIRGGRLPAELVGQFYVIREKDLEQVRIRRPGRPPAVDRKKDAGR